jgi:hypothetical protein
MLSLSESSAAEFTLIAKRLNYVKAKAMPPAIEATNSNLKGNFSSGIFEENFLSDIPQFAGN